MAERATDTPGPKSDWSVYTLKTGLPDSPAQMPLYRQIVPAGLPNGEQLAGLMAQLKITGTASTRTSEGGNTTMDITGDAGSVMLDSVDPLIMVLNTPQTSGDGTSIKIVPPNERGQIAGEFLMARALLDFPYLIEPPRLSRDHDRAIRIVPLIRLYRE